MTHEIEGIHWAFKSPITGPGYYVLLCNERDKGLDDPLSRFYFDPWDYQRAFKHYTKPSDCHDTHIDVRHEELSERTVMQRFGYLGEFAVRYLR